MSPLLNLETALPVVCQTLLQAGIRLLVQSSLLLLPGLAAGYALRRSGPARQLHVCQATLAAVALCALISLGLTGRLPSIAMLTLPSALTSPTTDSSHETATPSTPIPSSLLASQPRTDPVAAVGDLQSGTELKANVQVQPESASSIDDVNRSTAPFTRFLRPEQALGISRSGRLYTILTGVWLGVTALLLIWLMLCYVGIRRICKRAKSAQDIKLIQQLAALCAAQDVPAPALLISEDVHSVFLAGIRCPAILLPAVYLDQFNPSTLNAILAHEVMHLRAKDGWWTLATRLLCAVLWMQPLLWRLGRLREQASEEVCDQTVVALGCSPRDYANCLVTLAEQLCPSRVELVAGSGSVVFRSSLAQRVQKLMSGDWRHSVPVTRRFRIGIGLGSLLFALFLALAVSAAPLLADNAMDKDRRLDRKVTISAEGVPIGDLLTLVVQKTGIDISIDPDIADEKIIVFGPPRPLRDVMNDMAALFNQIWITDDTHPNRLRYRLVRSVRARQYEEDLVEETPRRIMARLEEQVRALSESPQDLAKRPSSDSIRKALSNPDCRVSTSIYALLSPQQQRQLIDRWWVRYPVSRLSSVQKDDIETLYHGKKLDELNNNPLVASGAAIPNPSVSRDEMEQQEVTFELHRSYNNGRVSEMSVSMSASTGTNMEMATIGGDVWFMLPPHGNPYTGQKISKEASLPTSADVQGAGGGGWPDRLRALSEKTGQPVLADYYRSHSVIEPFSHDEESPQPAVAALDTFCTPQNYLWWNRGSTLLFRKRDWYAQNLYEIPDRWMTAFIDRINARKSVLNLEDLLSLQQLSTDQIAGMNAGNATDHGAVTGLKEALAILAVNPVDKTKPLYSGEIGRKVRPSQVAIMPNLADPTQQALLVDFLQAWNRGTKPKDVKPGDFGFICVPDSRPEFKNEIRASIMIYPGKESMSIGYWLSFPLVLPDNRRDKTTVEVSP